MIRSYKDLDIWKKSMEAVVEIYKTSKKLPKEETFGLTSQIRRAAVSIPSNIAEGHTRNHTPEYRQFLYISLGSIAELETQLILSNNLSYLANEAIVPLLARLDELGKMIRGLIKRL